MILSIVLVQDISAGDDIVTNPSVLRLVAANLSFE
jgi:hypothetical protein